MLPWEKETESKFQKMLARVPVFHRGITKEAVSKKALENALARKADMVYEEDVVSAFFSEVPLPFYSMMVKLLDEVGFDYKKYGFPKATGASQKKR